MTDKNSNVSIEGYRCYNLYRKFKHKRARRNSGGMSIYVRECLNQGVSIVKNNFDTIVWLKFDCDFFNFDKDVYFCCLYLWPDESPAANVIDANLFDVIEQDVFNFEQSGRVYVAGDWNCRIGNKPDYIVCDKNIRNYDPDFYVPDNHLVRASLDNLCNTRGHKMLDLCKATGLRVANGRLGQLDNSCGFTYYSRGAHSVIDYLLLKEPDFDTLSMFEICPFNIFSDHAALRLGMRAIKPLTEDIVNNNESRVHTVYKWNTEHKEIFRRGLIAKLPDFNNLIVSADCSDLNRIDYTVDMFTNIISEVASPLFKREYKNNVPSQANLNIWYDKECVDHKILYKRALHNYNSNQSEINRIELCKQRKTYKYIVRKKKRAYKLKEGRKLSELRKSKPREFWKYFKSNNQSCQNDITVEHFKNYFSDLFNNIPTTVINEVENFNDNNDLNLHDPTYGELNLPITLGEVTAAVKRLGRNKSPCPSDNILNEYLIESIDIIGGHLTDLFNIVFNSGYFPDIWAQGYIIPIHKKGSKNDPNNYRGITLLSNLGKLFTGVLTARVEKWFESYNILSDAQFGFRKGHSTVDAIFALHNLIEHVISQGSRLPCAFVDLQKAFDSVYRQALWFKLYHLGLDGKLLKMFRSMYNIVKSCVKHSDSYSDFFNISIGLRQGLNNSPVMFALFLEDLELFLQGSIKSGLSIYDMCLIILLFADDMAIIGHSVEDLQASLDKLYEYCQYWGLQVNTSKTKIVVFRRRGGLKCNERWHFNNVPLEIVNDFNYLGVVFNYTGSFVLNNQYIVGKALKASNILLNNIKQYELSPSISLQLFDAFVGSILNYACPVWGFTKSKELERVHLKYCKTILGVKLSTSNVSVYGELGRYPLFIIRYTHIIKYWFKLLNTDNIILKCIYENARDKCENGTNNWPCKIKKLLAVLGFAEIWNFPDSVLLKQFLPVFKQRLIDCYLQEWRADVSSNGVLRHLYSYVKEQFCYELYLDKINCKSFRSALTRLRVSSHRLRIESGRYGRGRVERHERTCQFCDTNELEDEYHFVLKCSAYENLRSQYIKRYFYIRPSMAKFIELLQSKSHKVLTNLCYYLKKANIKRNDYFRNLQ